MSANLSLLEGTENDGCSMNCSRPELVLEGDADIDGVGVIIGFLGTAWLVVIIVILRYFLAFDPTANPFADPTQNYQNGRRRTLKPNPVDAKIIGMLSGLRQRFGHHSHWNFALTKVLLILCDVQILTGLGILFTSFVSLTCYMSAYHWQIISYLAWFSNLTHAACLTALREHLHRNQIERNFRMVLMLILLAGLIIAIVPTGYFNWAANSNLYLFYSFEFIEGTASVPASDARCFFSTDSIHTSWNRRLCSHNSSDIILDDRLVCNPDEGMKATTAYESSILSIILVTFSFFSRSVKMFRRLSDISKDTIRHTIGYWSTDCLKAVSRSYRRYENTRLRRILWNTLRPLDLMIGLYLVAKLYLEVLTSEMADLFWLFLSALWGTFRLFNARRTRLIDEPEEDWGFGQILPVFLLLGPIMTVSVSIISTLRKQQRMKRTAMNHHSITHALSLIFPYRNVSQQAIANDMGRALNIARDGDGESGVTSAVGQTFNTHHESEAIRLNNLQQSPGVDAMTDNEVAADTFSPSDTFVAHRGDVIVSPNQDRFTRTENVDMRASLSNHFSQSRWMVMVVWFFCLQLLILVSVVFYFLMVDFPVIDLSKGSQDETKFQNMAKPFSLLKSSALSFFFVQPMNCFILVVFGLYNQDDGLSKSRLSLCVLLFIVLLGYSTVTVIPFMSYYVMWYYPLGFLLITVTQLLYLSFR